jgi:hypothetical protein
MAENVEKKFVNLMFEKARDGIRSIPDTTATDIYALSFYFYGHDDDPRQATLAVGYNTNARANACTPVAEQKPKWPIASDANEAKWNYAFWLQEEGTACTIGGEEGDASLRQKWIESFNCWWTDEEQEEDFDRTIELGEKVMCEFVNLCMQVASRLHNEGVIKEKFGRDVPIIIHELEYNDQHAQATEAANPKGLAKEFTEWIGAM